MNQDELVLRQQHLLARSAQLRATLSQQTQVFKRPLAIADQVQAGLLWLYQNPAWPIGAVVVFIVLRPQRAIRWGGRLWWAWKTFRQAQGLIAALPMPSQAPATIDRESQP